MAGFRELLAVERDAHAVAVLRHNFPDVPIFHGDVRRLDAGTALRLLGLKPGELDLLDGSPPCQGFSMAGRRDPSDARNGLFREFARLVEAFRPKVFVMENVPGLVRGRMRPIFGEMLRALKGCGYAVSVRLLNAMYFQVPQSRERLIFLGLREDLRQNSGLAPSHPAAQSRPIPMSAAIGDLPVSPDPGRGHVWLDESPSGRDTRTWRLAQHARQGETYAGRQRRLVWSEPCRALLKASAGGTPMPYLRGLGCHPLYTRTLSPLEYKRLASFPDAFEFPGPWTLAYDRVGNSVPPLLMRAIARHVRAHLLDRMLHDPIPC
jgi:DNA (cytosine-5)-methyltransferase 1